MGKIARLLAVAALAFAVLAGLNVASSARFNQATSSLNANLKLAVKNDADLDALDEPSSESSGASDAAQKTPWRPTESGAIPFVHLHTHSHYSLLDGLGKLEALIERAKELEMPALAITDHGNMYAALEF